MFRPEDACAPVNGVTIGTHDGMLPLRCQTITRTNDDVLQAGQS